MWRADLLRPVTSAPDLLRGLLWCTGLGIIARHQTPSQRVHTRNLK